jgi:hypothetical protein
LSSSTSTALGWDNSKSLEISRELVQSPVGTVAIMVCSLILPVSNLISEVLCVISFLSYGVIVPIFETLQRLDNVARVCVLRIPVHENRLDVHGHRGLAARRSVICVCIS